MRVREKGHNVLDNLLLIEGIYYGVFITFPTNKNEVDCACPWHSAIDFLVPGLFCHAVFFSLPWIDPTALHLTSERFSVVYIYLITPTH